MGQELPGPVQEAIKLERAKRSPDQQKLLRNYFIENVNTTTRPVYAALGGKGATLDAGKIGRAHV